MRVPLPLIGPSYTNRALPLSAQVSKNLYPEVNSESRNIVSLNPYPGLVEFSTLSGAGRGLEVMADTLFAVSGSKLYRVDSLGNETDLGEIAGSGICGLANDGEELAIATGSTPYVFNGTLQQIADPDLVNPTTVDYMNSQFLFDQNDGQDGEFVVSDVGTALAVDALNFAQAESHPDDIRRIIAYNQIAYLLGSKTLEPWFNDGVSTPPFSRVEGGVKPYGLAGRDAVGITDDYIYFLDSKRMPRRLLGVDSVPIGNPALGQEWEKYDRVDDAVGMAFTLDQQNFWQLTFPSADRTWCYHEPSNSWFQPSYGVDNGRHRAIAYANAYGKHLVQDHSNGKIYELSFDAFTDDGAAIQRVRATANIEGGLYGAPGQKLFFERVEFVVQTGEGTATGQGSEPVVMIRHSDDGGRTWSASREYSLGQGGEYLKKIELFQQGSAYQRIYELTQTDPVPTAMISAHADISVGI